MGCGFGAGARGYRADLRGCRSCAWLATIRGPGLLDGAVPAHALRGAPRSARGAPPLLSASRPAARERGRVVVIQSRRTRISIGYATSRVRLAFLAERRSHLASSSAARAGERRGVTAESRDCSRSVAYRVARMRRRAGGYFFVAGRSSSSRRGNRGDALPSPKRAPHRQQDWHQVAWTARSSGRLRCRTTPQWIGHHDVVELTRDRSRARCGRNWSRGLAEIGRVASPSLSRVARHEILLRAVHG